MNPQLLLASYAKKQLSDSGVRKVVDKMFDVSLNRRIVEWSGTDRPEFTDFGVSKVCVEAERENYFLDSDASSDPAFGVHTEVSFDLNDWGYKYGTHELNGKAVFEDNTTDRVYYNTATLVRTTPKVLTCLIKPDDGQLPTFGTGSGDLCRIVINNGTATLDSAEEVGHGIFKVVASHPGGEGSDTNANGLWKMTGNNDVGFEATAFQLEEGSYPTNYIPTSGSTVTRLAPTVPIEDALPETGTVAGKVDMVRTVGITQYLIDNGGTTFTDRFFLGINAANDCIFIPWANAPVMSPDFPFDVDDKERFTLEYAGSYDGSNAYLFVRVGGEQYLFTGSYTVGDDSVRDVQMGARNGSGQSSMRWEVLHHKDTIVRTTEEEFEQLFEVIS